MPDYIAAGIVSIIICILLAQNPAQTVMHHKISQSEVIVNTACEQAKQEGYFTPTIIAEMKEKLVDTGLEPSEISIEVTTTPKYRTNEFDSRELITYKIGIPLKNLVAGNKLVGISDDDNSTIKYFQGAIASEKVVN